MKTVTKTLNFPGVKVHSNLSTPRLIEASLLREEGVLASNGALCCDTGDRTGRSPNDKFVEDTPGIHDAIAWGNTNKAISAENFAKIEALATEYLSQKDELFRFDGFAGADERYRLNVSVVTEEAWQCLFASTMFLSTADPDNFEPDWTIIDACNFRIKDYESLGLYSEVCIIQSMEQKKVVICGTRYAGEIKKSIFYAMNFDMTEVDVFPMHCSANIDKDDETNVALFFGLSGTGKTTLSADPNRPLIGDDEHGWDDDGVFNFEGGCYAKTINLSEESEPDIYRAIRRDALLENVSVDAAGVIDYADGSKTENTRVSYPIYHIDNIVKPISKGGHAEKVIFLTADAFGVLPPVSKLTPNQTKYHFLSGFTAKLAGTERGITEPTPTFSSCFGAAFLSLHPTKYAHELVKRMEAAGSTAYLVNTGWNGTGKRISIKATRAIIHAILDGSIDKAETFSLPYFNLEVPIAIDSVEGDILDPRHTYADADEWDEKAHSLAELFIANFVKFTDTNEGKGLVAAGPQLAS